MNTFAVDHGIDLRTDERRPAATGRDAAAVMSTDGADDFDELFTEHYERLVRTLTAVAGDREAASDAVQDAFVRAHLRWRRVRRYDDPAGWVRRVAINRLHDHHRSGTRRQRLLHLLSSRHEHTTPAPDIDEFDRLLDVLPRQQRAVTALFYVDGLTVAEIATALEIADGSVKSHLHDARQRLRGALHAEAESNRRQPSDTSDWSRTS